MGASHAIHVDHVKCLDVKLASPIICANVMCAIPGILYSEKGLKETSVSNVVMTIVPRVLDWALENAHHVMLDTFSTVDCVFQLHVIQHVVSHMLSISVLTTAAHATLHSAVTQLDALHLTLAHLAKTAIFCWPTIPALHVPIPIASYAPYF